MDTAKRVIVVIEQMAGETGKAQETWAMDLGAEAWERLRQECLAALARGLVYRVTVGTVPCLGVDFVHDGRDAPRS